jgi:imidazolonepropionase
VRAYGLSPAEAILGATREAAASLGLERTCGALAAGLAADLVAWDLPHETALVQPWGVPRARCVLRDAAVIAGALPASESGASGVGLPAIPDAPC